MKYLALLNKHKLLFAITALVIMTGAVLISYLLPKIYEARSTIFIEKNVLSELFKGPTGKSETDDIVKGLGYSIKSRSLFTKVISDLDLNLGKKSDAQLEALIVNLQNKTVCKLNKDEGLITISFTNNDPRIARDFVNALVRRYIEQNLSSKREESYGATSFISEQIQSIKEKLERSEAEILKLKMERGAELVAEPASMQTQINASQQRMDELILRHSQLEAARKRLRNDNPAQTRLVALRKKLEELRVEYTDNYPEVVKVKADIDAAEKEISSVASATVIDSQELERVEAELRAVRISEANQRALLANSRGLMHANPNARTALEKLEQERNSNRVMYDQLMATRGRAEVSKQLAVQDKSTTFRIVDPAVMPLSPISPDRLRIMLIGIAAGIMGGFGIILAVDFFDKTVKTVDTLKALGVNVLAVIPKINDPKAVEQERRQVLRLYIASGAYFSMILVLLTLEFLGKSPVDRIIGLINK